MITIKKGLDVPISGLPEQTNIDTKTTQNIALVGKDYLGLVPTMKVAEGDTVQKGQLLWEDKKNPGVFFTAPASGLVTSINRGPKRVLNSLVIAVDTAIEEQLFTSYKPVELENLDDQTIKKQMNQAGIWSSLRTRPFSKVPRLDSKPASIFITAIDTHPLAANPEIVINENPDAFEHGLIILKKLTEGKLHICTNINVNINPSSGIKHEFSGPHPAGLVGTHISFIDPVSPTKTVWHIGYQDVIALGKLFTTGRLYTDKIISLAGPSVKKPRLIKVQLGADLAEITANELKTDEVRIISGSVFGGRTAVDDFAYLGRYHNQVSVIPDSEQQLFLSWLNPAIDRYSILNLFFSKLIKNRLFDFSTTTNGSCRAMLPIGNYERVMPLNLLPTQLLRALITSDTVEAQRLGALELDEEDLALCTYVCAGKNEYAPLLRKCLTSIEKEGY